MKRILIGVGTALLACSMGASAHMRGGHGPHAWCDKHHDGRCDITGKPVGPRGGRTTPDARRGANCPDCGQKQGCCHHHHGQAQTPPAEQTPAPKPENKK